MTIKKQQFFDVALKAIKKIREKTAKGKINWMIINDGAGGNAVAVYESYAIDGEKIGRCIRYTIKLSAEKLSHHPLETIENDKVTIKFYSDDDDGHGYILIGQLKSDDPFIKDTALEAQMVGLYNDISESTCTSEEEELYYALDDICIGLGE